MTEGEDINNFGDIDPDFNHFENDHLNCNTYSTESFISTVNLDNKSLNIFHNNAQSIMRPGKLDEYIAIFGSLKVPFDSMVFTETWLTNDNKNLCTIDGYKPIHLIRPNGDDNIDFKEKGGGVSIFIKNGISYKERDDLTILLPYMECLFIEMHINKKKYIIGGFYRVPDTNINLFIEKYNDIVEQLKTNYELILVGDFNIDLLKDDTSKNNFMLCIQSNYLIPVITNITRIATKINNNGIAETSETLIDNIFIKANTSHVSGVIETHISDHFSIFTSIPLVIKETNHISEIKYRSINDYNQRKFNYQLTHSDIFDLLNENDGKVAFSRFFEIFNNKYDRNFPVSTKTISKKDAEKPWITDIIKKRISIRDKLFKLSEKNFIPRKIFNDFRNKLNKQIVDAKAKYYEQEFKENENNLKNTWSIINRVLNSKNKNMKVSISNDNGEEFSDSEIPTKFIEYFTTIADKLTSQIPNTQTKAESYLRDRINNSFYFAPSDPSEILKVIGDLKNNGKGLHAISTTVIDSCKHIIAPVLTHIINLCVKDGYFPDELKTGCITPIYKGGNKDLINNYRPVCSLNPFSKIIEKVIYNRMISFIDKNNIFSPTQFGFRKGMSTETALIDYIDSIHSGLNKKHYIISVLMDLSKAFDLMNHNILKTKLEHYGFRGVFLNFLTSFLTDREYFVSVNGIKSTNKSVKIGVPQGSTLGPLLFLIYVNDMKNSSDILKFTQFADDSTTTYSHSNLRNAITTIETEFEKVLTWLLANRLVINLNKTHLMLFTNRKRPDEISLNVNGNSITEKVESKFLGVMVDNKLSWQSHIKHISNKISKSLSILRYLRYSFPKHILKTLYLTLVLPYITYCNIIWGAAFKTVLMPLFILQKKCLRTITKSNFLAHTLPLFIENKLLNVFQLFDFNCAQFIFKVLNTSQYPAFKEKIIQSTVNHDHNTRNSHLIRSPFQRLQKCINSFFINGIKVYNNTSQFVKNSRTINVFKVRMKNWLFYGSN